MANDAAMNGVLRPFLHRPEREPLGMLAQPPAVRIALGAGIVLLVLGLKVLFPRLLGSSAPFLLMFAAITTAAWLGGAISAAIAAAIGCVSVGFLFFRPLDAIDLERLAVFLVEGSLVTGLSLHLQRARSRALASAAEVTRNQRALQESEERYRLLVENLPNDAILMLHADGRIASWSAAADRLTGYSSAEALGQPLTLLDAGTSGSGLLDAVASAAREGTARAELWGRRKDGQKFWAEVALRRLSGSDGRLGGFSSVVRDTTERRRTEEALRESNQRLSAILDTAVDCIITIDERGTILSANRAVSRVFGYAPEELVGKPIEVMMPQPYKREHAGYMARYLRTGERRIIGIGREVTAQRKDGSVFPIELAVSETWLPDRRIFTGLVRDITDRRAAEDALRAAKESLEQRVAERTAALTAAMKELEAFSYSVSHDLRAPLRGMEGFSKLLVQRYVSQLDDQGRHYLERIRAGTQRMAELIDELLKLSRVTRANLRKQKTDLAAIAHEVAAELQRGEPDRSMDLRIESPLPIEADPQLMRVVLENLLGNAWKFTARSPSPRVELCRADQDGEQIFMVRDNGAGFDMRYAEKLFAPFQRLHDASDFEGIGIGLATVQRIIQKHGGRIWAQGEPEVGATIFFTLGGDAT